MSKSDKTGDFQPDFTQENDIFETNIKYLTFWTDNQLFGISIANVEQIIGVQEITEIPEFPGYAKGIINLRGKIIPVIDVRLRFNKAEVAYNERTCIIVTIINDDLVGFIVDEVDEVVDIEPNKISAPPRLSDDAVDSYLIGVAKLTDGVVLIVDSAKILSFDLLEEVIV